MQPLVAPERAHLTAVQVQALIEQAPAVTLSAGLEIVDLGLNVLEDISGDLAGGNISRNSYAELHSSCDLQITRTLEWGSDIVRPYMVMDDGASQARFNLGAYHINTPDYSVAVQPVTYAVTGYDMLLRLHQPVGDAFSVAAGVSYLEAIEAILVERGYQAYLIDQSAAALVTTTGRTWAFDETITWLTIVNDLLQAVGYEGIWSDWDGRLRCQAYVVPVARSIEWYYADDSLTTLLTPERDVSRDYFSSPNRWVFYRSGNADEAAPVEDAGRYTYVNQSVGDTSVDARNGLVITKVVGIDAADQASLVSAAQITIQADMNIPIKMAIRTWPNPLHWHFDRILVSDSATIPFADALCTEWRLPLPPDLGHMEQQWTVLAQ